MDEVKKERRKWGTGRVWQDGGVWWIQYYAHGQQIRESSGSPKQTVAEKLLDKRLSEKKAGVLRITSAEKLRYEEMRAALYAKYRNEGKRSLRRSKKGVEWIAGVHPHLDDHFAGWRASQITTAELRKFIDKRVAEGASKGTINGSLAMLSSMFWIAFKDNGLLRRDDIPYFPLFRDLKNQRWIKLDKKEFERLRTALPEHLQAPVRLAYLDGLRREEIFGLKWSDVDWDANVIRLQGKVTKSGEPRVTPMVGPVLADLKALYPKRTPGLGFVFEKDGARIRSFRKAWASAIKRAKLPVEKQAFVFHGLRYCAVSNLTSAGMPQVLAQRITGHKTASMWKRYNISSEADVAEAGALVAAYIEKGEHPEKGAQRGNTTDSEAPEQTTKQALPF